MIEEQGKMGKPTRGERNNNPGNIREGVGDKIHWQGERAQDDDSAFEEFDTPEMGIRALGKTFLTYYEKYGLKTVRRLINRWAPPVENDTDAYVDMVCHLLRVDEATEIDLRNSETLRALVKAVIRQENGRCIYSNEQLDLGVNMALGKPVV